MGNRMHIRAWIALFFFLSPVSRGDTVTQSGAEKQADELYRDASDQSLQASVVNAMRAMTQLGQGSIPGAFRAGVTAFGEWDNSNNLDRTSRDAFAARRGLGDNSGKPPPAQTTFRRLDPSFLHKGEAAKVAAEFEKATGMKRETFLRRMSEASDNPILLSDPRVISKYVDRIDNLTKDMPNGNVKTVFHKTLRAIPVGWLDVSSAAVKNAIAAAASRLSPAPAVVAPRTVASLPSFERIPAAPAPAAEVPGAAVSPKLVEAPSSAVVSNAFMKDILLAQNSKDEESLFFLVHRRYQAVTARLQ